MNKDTPAHLGGHAGVTHIDIAALNWAKEKFEVKTALDIGCGVGDMVKVMLDAGIEAYGIEGDPNLNWGRPECFIRHDYTEDGLMTCQDSDLGWCVEFLEHVEEQYLDNVFATFKECKVLIVTAAPPGTEEAHHHVNCKDANYWIVKFAENGFKLDEEATTELRRSSSMTRHFMRETGMVYVRTEDYGIMDLPEWMRIEQGMINETSDNKEIEIPNYHCKPDSELESNTETITAEDVECDIDLQNQVMLSEKVTPEMIKEFKEKFDIDLNEEVTKMVAYEMEATWKDNRLPIDKMKDKNPIKIPVDKENKLYHPVTKKPLKDNQDLIEEKGKVYIVTRNPSGAIRKGSKKEIIV